MPSKFYNLRQIRRERFIISTKEKVALKQIKKDLESATPNEETTMAQMERAVSQLKGEYGLKDERLHLFLIEVANAGS